MVQIVCEYCKRKTDKYYNCPAPDYRGEGYCCEECYNKYVKEEDYVN